MKSAENKSSLINYTDYLSAKYDADSINITHSVIDDEVHLKISVTNSKTPSRLTLVNKNTNNLKVIAKINVESQSSFELIDENNYEGTAGDVVGKAKGYSYGPAFKFEYVLLVPVKGKEIKITFDDWIFKQDDRVAINRATMTKFGFKVAELTVVFVKD